MAANLLMPQNRLMPRNWMMPKNQPEPTYQLVVHQYTDTAVGHVNVEFKINDVSAGFFGANLKESDVYNPNEPGLAGGIYDESIDSKNRIKMDPKSHTSVTINLTKAEYDASKKYSDSLLAQTKAGKGDYDAFGGNCVDFMGEVLERAGEGGKPLTDFLKQKATPTYIYADVTDFFNVNPEDYLLDYESMGWLLPHNMDISSYRWIEENYGPMSNVGFFAEVKIVEICVELFGGEQECYLNPDEAERLANENLEYGSPIAIDLDGDGIETLSFVDSGVLFDIDGDGKREITSWLNGDDAFIAMDSNGNGIVDGVNELFGGMERGAGYAKLAGLDANGDGLLNADDELYSALSVWRDLNHNGITELGELQSLSALGVTELGLAFETTDIIQNGNLIGESSHALLNGKEVSLADIYFKYTDDAKTSPSLVSVETDIGLTTIAVDESNLDYSVESHQGAIAKLIEYMSTFDDTNSNAGFLALSTVGVQSQTGLISALTDGGFYHNPGAESRIG